MTDTREGHGAMDDFFGVVDRLPYLGSLKRDLEQLRRLLYDRRAARVLVVGAEAAAAPRS